MKKRLRKTGEIVDVIDWHNYCEKDRDKDDWVSYVDANGVEHHNEKGLNIYWDFENVEEGLTKEIDWEQLRIKAAVSALQGFASNPNITSVTDKELAEWSVSCADYLIAELKKGGEE